MNEINKKWRCFPVFDDKGEVVKSNFGKFDCDDGMVFINKGSTVIDNKTFSGGRSFICKIDDKVLRIVSFYIPAHKQAISLLKNKNITIIDNYLLDNEGWIDFNYSDADVVCKLLGAKKQRKSPVPLQNKNDNYTLYVRTFLHIDKELIEVRVSK